VVGVEGAVWEGCERAAAEEEKEEADAASKCEEVVKVR